MLEPPLIPEAFALRRERLQRRIWLKREMRQSPAAEIAQLRRLVHEQLRAEFRAERQARRAAARRDPRQLHLLDREKP